jgi:hypothetical protein
MRTKDQHLDELYGLPVLTFPGPGAAGQLPAADAVAWRIGREMWTSEELWREDFARFCAEVDLGRVRALVVGAWEDPEDTDPSEAIDALVAVRDRLPALRALFLGDITDKECHLARISQTDVTPLPAAFPALEEFGVRAGWGMSLGRELRLDFPALRHAALRRLTVQSAGMPAAAVRGIAASGLPALEHLELWLGDAEFGADHEVADLAPILSGARLPRLRHLALRNSRMQDEVAAAVASAPLVPRLEVLDLSWGALTDDGAAALLDGQPLTHLKKLDLHFNFLGEAMRRRVHQALEPAGVEVDTDPGAADGALDPEICAGPVSY